MYKYQCIILSPPQRQNKLVLRQNIIWQHRGLQRQSIHFTVTHNMTIIVSLVVKMHRRATFLQRVCDDTSWTISWFGPRCIQ